MNNFKDPSSLDEIAAVLVYLDDILVDASFEIEGNPQDATRDFTTFEDAKRAYDGWVAGLETAPKHCGDCVNLPCTCPVCVVEDYREKARKEISKYLDINLITEG
jgi:hypothetical protein